MRSSTLFNYKQGWKGAKIPSSLDEVNIVAKL